MGAQQILLGLKGTVAFVPTLLAHTASNSGAPQAVTTSAIDTTGAKIIVVCLAPSGPNLITYGDGILSDSKSNSWTRCTTFGDSTDVVGVVYYCINPTAGSGHTFTFGDTDGRYTAISVMAFNVPVTSFTLQTGTATSTSNTVQAGSGTPVTTNSLVIAVLGSNETGVSIDSSFTIADHFAGVSSVNYALSDAYKFLSAISAQNPTWTGAGGASAKSPGMAIFAY